MSQKHEHEAIIKEMNKLHEEWMKDETFHPDARYFDRTPTIKNPKTNAQIAAFYKMSPEERKEVEVFVLAEEGENHYALMRFDKNEKKEKIIQSIDGTYFDEKRNAWAIPFKRVTRCRLKLESAGFVVNFDCSVY
jgi:hypothetical protein